MNDLDYALGEVVSSIPEPTVFSSHRVLRQRVLLLWWHNDCQVVADGMVSRGNAQKSQTLKPAWARLRQYSLAKVGQFELRFKECGNLIYEVHR
ncbi:hypothetical protein Hanom_Chr01g00089961 [Helianthus anomalus]